MVALDSESELDYELEPMEAHALMELDRAEMMRQLRLITVRLSFSPQ
jgi:hypothetical protein